MTRDESLRKLEDDCRTAKSEFEARFGGEIESYRQAIAAAVQSFVADLRDMVGHLADHNPVCDGLTERTGEYLDWLQWTFWDLPYFAAALRLPADHLQEGVKSCGMAYLSLRIVDDVVDRHFTYKGRHETLLALFEKDRGGNQRAEGLTILAGLLVCFTALRYLSGSANSLHVQMLGRCLEALQQCTIGAIVELSPREVWTEEYYERLIRLKNVAFWETLYAGIDPAETSPLLPFLAKVLRSGAEVERRWRFSCRRTAVPAQPALHSSGKANCERLGQRARRSFIPAGAEEALLPILSSSDGLPIPFRRRNGWSHGSSSGTV